ncbi:MAG: acyl-CoA dehydrogenase family protein [Streptosporangiaceae bacterium]
MPIAITAEQLALQASIREWAKRAGTIEAVRSQEKDGAGGPVAAGPAAERWASLAELGVFGIGLPVASGGTGGGAADLAAAVAELTDSLAPGPLLPTLLGALLLSRCATQQQAVHQHAAAAAGQASAQRRRAGSPTDAAADRQLALGSRRHPEPDYPFLAALRGIAAGHISVAVALEPGAISAQPGPDGTFRLSGHAGPLLGGGSTTQLLVGATADCRSVWCLLPADDPGVSLRPLPPADFSRSLADVTLAGVVAGPAAMLPGVTTDDVRDLAAALFAVEAAAVAGWCVRTAAEYAAIRQQFGRPIGTFQAVKHLCASMACRAESAAVLAWDAARAVDDGAAVLALPAAAAAAFCLDAGAEVAKDCIQVLGGIGFTWEHDAHLYLRRAVALRQLLGGSAAWRDRAAALAVSGIRRQLTVDSGLADDDDLAAVRALARQAAASIAALPASSQRVALAESGYAAPSWPPPYGLSATPAGCLVIDEELARSGLARPDLVIGGWALAAILSHGSPAQQDRFAGPTLRGEIAWCQLFSEPDAGSDLAALRTRAERVDGGWLLTGQKVWTSLATQADWAICLARTDTAAAKHQGLTFFLVAMASPGIDIRPLREITGRQMFNQVFLDQVFVPEACGIGKPGDGWRIARTTLASERVAMGAGSSVGGAVEQLLELASKLGVTEDPLIRQRLGALIAEGMAVSLLDLQAVLSIRRGEDRSGDSRPSGPRGRPGRAVTPADTSGSLAAVRKLAGVAHRQAVAEAALELAGPAGATANDATLQEFLLTRCLSIAGGTTQILLSLVGERLLGLPREEAR